MKLLMITQKIDMTDPVMGFAHGWVKKLANSVEKLYVITLYKGVMDLPENVEVLSLGKEKNYSRWLRYVLFYIHLFKVWWRVDGVFLHMCPEYAKAIYPLQLLSKKKSTLWYAHVKTSPLAVWAASHVDTVLSPSSDSFLSGGSNFISTGHGIDTNVFKPDPLFVSGACKNIVHVGRISKIKEVEVIIKAVGHLVHTITYTDFILNIYGGPARPEDYAYVEELKKLVRDLHIDQYVVWHGELKNSEAAAVYQKADVFIRSMPKGGYGKVDLEALATAVPTVLSTPVYESYFGDLYKDMYFPGGEYVQLAERMVKVLGWDVQTLQRFKHIARDLVMRDHNLDTLAGKIVNTFR